MSPFTQEQVLELLQSHTSLAWIDFSGANLEANNLGGVNLNHANPWKSQADLGSPGKRSSGRGEPPALGAPQCGYPPLVDAPGSPVLQR